MRWFKHLSTAAEDEKLALIIDEFGMEGYGLYWRILEILAQQLNYTADPTVSYTPKKWKNNLWITCGKLLKFLVFCQKIEIFSVTFTQISTKNNENLEKSNQNSKKSKEKKLKNGKLSTVEIISISCPNLLKYRDEWASKKARGQSLNSGVTPESLRSKDTDTDTEIKNGEGDAHARASSIFLNKNSKKKISAKFVPNEDDRKLAKEVNIDLKRETQKFIDHFLGTGEVKADWHAVFRNWLRRGSGWGNYA